MLLTLRMGLGRHIGLMGYGRTWRHDAKDVNSGDVTTEAGDTRNRFYLPDEVVNSIDDDAKVTTYLKKTLYDLFYEDFLFDNSKGKITIKVEYDCSC